ncbi:MULTISPECIES: site-specific DNA-methyltransferase [unclassified Shinella]|uniref:site-specific DNA-methyltransferase n=1 Tax=unclassified Shinella TaxID=2643062 RepID=UPI00225D5840|nr:site-specific DNA-methyltransferase [Shinella sp. YE25]MDC7259589.1 site-specific DNA-methyltransferase [Shinella sp. YE25]CAI0334173.1 Site-specific DNA-methyltransferase (adenine-specific) [Rhizobiaceae bacterium]CAK7261827.1 adenine-specific DNA-methyltransferase [Shinella sp. WSC3-e]
MVQDNLSGTSIYKHKQESVQRPDVGVEAQFSSKKAPRTYRYDSSLAPELSWDENADRAFAEWLLTLVADAAEKGEAAVFAEPQVWQGTEERFTSLSQCAARLRSLTKPFLNWTGKAERQQVTVPTLPLFVHERHSTQAILETLKSHKALGTNLDLFGDIDLDVADKLDAYEHKGPWTNRLVLGDSLQVMNSLLEYEGMGGQVQMIYFDPPYGVKYGSNFQPFVRQRDVKHGPDNQMIREPEMVKAYRDTWELGLHSYLTYLRDRLTLTRELLTEAGSVFVQISDDNLHHVREVLDEVFGAANFCSIIAFNKTSGFSPKLLSNVADYLLWYAKDIKSVKYQQIYLQKELGEEGATQYTYVESLDGSVFRSMTAEEQADPSKISGDFRILTHGDMSAQGTSGNTEPFDFNGKIFRVPANCHWKTTPNGMRKLAENNRLLAMGNSLRYKRYLSDFPLFPVSNVWTDTGTSGFAAKKLYTVQTNPSVVQRCMLMTTEPGDLVLDITCGSGTTAVVAEQWGRRWITVDTSRVPIALARQRLLTSTYPWYRLKEPATGPLGGFVYERKRNNKGEETGGLVPRITLKSIANDEDPKCETIPDRAETNDKITRVCGPFTVEATIQAAMSLEEDAPHQAMQPQSSSPRSYLDRMIEVLRQSKTLRLPGNVTLELEAVSPLSDREYLHAEGVARDGTEKRIAFVFGPEDGAIGSEYVFNAHTEALQQGFQQLFLFGFAIQAKAREMLDKLKIPTVYVSVTPDVVMSDLLKTSKASEIFSITGLPDVELQAAGKRDDGTPLRRVVIKGLDIFRPDTMETDEIKAENLPCWMLDTNYNGMAFLASQVFFPKTSAWDNLQKSLKGQFADTVWEHLAGTVSEPFVLGDKKRIAVKAIDERGNELMVVKSAEEAR